MDKKLILNKLRREYNMKKLIENIFNMYKADKDKKFYDKRWVYVVIIFVVIGVEVII
jgi:hypothetical protein